MRQYWELKSRFQDCLLFFRLGDFYEMFFEDAERASRLLGLTLTARDAGGDTRAPMCGVPYHSAQGYIARLLKHCEKVALCEQMEDPKLVKGLVKRDVVRVLTPVTVVEGDLLEERINNWLVAVARAGSEWGVACVDLSTGEFKGTGGDGPGTEMKDELARLRPAELVGAAEALAESGAAGCPATTVEPVTPAEARTALLRHFGTASLAAYGLEERLAQRVAAAVLLGYAARMRPAGLSHLTQFVSYEPRTAVRLDPYTLDALEVVEPQRRGGPTLLTVLDASCTGMGGRTLRQWLVRPPALAGEILSRLDAVEWLVDRTADREAFRGLLGRCADLERIGGRLGSAAASPRDLAALRVTLGLVGECRIALAGAGAPGWLAELGEALNPLPELGRYLARALVDEPPLVITEGGMIRDGFHPEVDELRGLAKNGKGLLLELQERERKRTGIETLKVTYNSVFGYTLELTRGKAHLAPADWTRRQTLSGVERYVTEELKVLERKILGAEERLSRLEQELFLELRAHAATEVGSILATARALGRLDALGALAETAAKRGWIRPVMDAGGAIEIVEGRHPVLEREVSAFVANDVRLLPWQEQIMLVTGPNMAGKSTFLRQTALLTLMAHAGSFVPAKSARIAAVDGIFCRIGTSDRLAEGQSTFMVEMTEVSHMLRHATERSLLIFDEVGRGTSTYDGLSIAWAVVEHLARTLGAKTLFATHFYELTALAEELPAVRNLNVLVREWRNELVFLYKIVPGRADRSYGVQVARLAGLPATVVTRARELLAGFEKGSAAVAAAGAAGAAVDRQLTLFGPLPDPVRARLEEADVERLTPLQAMNLVHELKEMLDGGRGPDAGYSDA